MGMHLKEYTYQELKELLKRAGFKDIQAVLGIPLKITQLFGISVKPRASRTYLDYLCAVDKLISLLPSQTFRRKAGRRFMFILFSPGILIIAKKE